MLQPELAFSLGILVGTLSLLAVWLYRADLERPETRKRINNRPVVRNIQLASAARCASRLPATASIQAAPTTGSTRPSFRTRTLPQPS
jgi:hypothetical protein